jgi:hypothetical protein
MWLCIDDAVKVALEATLSRPTLWLAQGVRLGKEGVGEGLEKLQDLNTTHPLGLHNQPRCNRVVKRTLSSSPNKKH